MERKNDKTSQHTKYPQSTASNTTIYIVPDGGVHKYEGNYGVVMAQGINILASTNVTYIVSSFMNLHIGQNYTECWQGW
jgi:hypothetical protein